ncbi:hypothetical protein [Halapricum sp. CBA1109]|nr:hypothetical protein [Halapricum sp. CBA1109]
MNGDRTDGDASRSVDRRATVAEQFGQTTVPVDAVRKFLSG